MSAFFNFKCLLIILNSADLVNTLSQIRVDEDESLISFDVSALFPSVPVEESLTLIYKKLAADPDLHTPKKFRQ